MRKALAIGLLAIHLFNMGGYQLFFQQLANRASKNFVAKIDVAEYNESSLIEIRVPINLPYQPNWTDYERYDGEIMVDGVHYNYVKRKLVNDSMSLLCIPNADKMRIYNARETFFSLVNDVKQESKHGETPSPLQKITKLVAEYESTLLQHDEHFVFANISSIYHHYSSSVLEGVQKNTERPPAMIEVI